MKMKGRSPARVLSCHHGGLVLTCFTLVSLLVTNTSGSSQVQGNTRQPSPILPRNITPRNSSSPSQLASPPTKAIFVMQCKSPAGDVYDHCWLDDNTLVTVHQHTKKVIKATINRRTKTCTYSYYTDDPPAPYRVACSPDGDEIYVINYLHSSVWVYDRNSLKSVWKPEGLAVTPRTVAMNRQIIVIGIQGRGHVYLYNRNRVYLGQVSISNDQFYFCYTQLTEEGVLVATADYGDDRLVIHDILHGSTIAVGGTGSENGQFRRPIGVSITGDYILLSDNCNNRVPVYSRTGGFQGNLKFKGADASYIYPMSYRLETNLLVITREGQSSIKIFSLENDEMI